MGLVTAKEVAQAMNVDKLGFVGTFMGWTMMRILKISKANKIYDRNKHLSDIEFLDAILEEYQVRFEIPEEDLKRLPKDGAYITISNHPLGGIDGILLLKFMLEKRPDFKIMGNFLLHRIEPLKPYVMAVNPFEEKKDIKSSIGGFKQALSHLKAGSPLGIFPAGEVSTCREDEMIIDRPWEEAAMKLIKKAELPVVPIYFHGKNSRFFYRLSRISDTLRTAQLPSEMLSQKNRLIKVRIGNAISVKAQKEHENLGEFTDFLRRKTYMLARTFEKKSLLSALPRSLKAARGPQKIVKSVKAEWIEKEVSDLRDNDRRLTQSKNYEVFLAPASEMPNILQELGRLREITFRAVGEGTNEPSDLDRYDAHYHHLFLWDEEAKKIAGAYRMGLGSQILPAYGIDGFYTQSLFRFEPELHKMMGESIEMGRAFVIKEYQQKPMPLFLLWKGIIHTTLRYPEHNYLIGGVTISNQFSSFSKSLMIEFMRSHYYDPYIAQYIRPKKEYKVKLKDADKEFVFDETENDLNKLDKLIEEMETGNLRVPVLIKKYIKQNAKVVAFNVDPLFNDAIDGLMYIRIADLPENTVKPVLEEFQVELEKKMED